jgi:hypothetical protein
MKRLIAKHDAPIDKFLGAPIEIIYPKSKFIGYRGWIDNVYHDGKYYLMLEPQQWENTSKWHRFNIKITDIYKWVRILPLE